MNGCCSHRSVCILLFDLVGHNLGGRLYVFHGKGELGLGLY